MRLFHVLLALVGALLLGAWLAPPLGEDPGYVLIRFQGWAFETTAVALALLIIAVYFLFRVALWLIRMPGRAVRGAVEGRREARLERGLLAYAEGRWSRAERLLASGARGSSDPAAHYLAAARAAHSRRDEAGSERYLALAEGEGERAQFAVELTRAEMLMADGHTAAATALLESLNRDRPRNERVMRLLAEGYRALEDWAGLRRVITAMRKAGLMEASEAEPVLREAAAADMAAAEDAKALESVWSSLTRAQHKDPKLVLAYGEKALAIGRGEAAADPVQKTLRRDWDEDLILLYGRLPHADPVAALKKAEGWLKNHPESSALMLTLGRLCRSAELWGKSREYLERSLTFGPRAETYRELAELKERDGDTAGAMACYRNVVHLNRDEPVEPVPVEGLRSLRGPETGEKSKEQG